MYDQNQIINLKCFDFKGFEILLSILLGRGVLPSHSLNSIAITAGGKAVVTGKGVVPAVLFQQRPCHLDCRPRLSAVMERSPRLSL